MTTGTINFWPQFIEPILKGQKIQTRRRGIKRGYVVGQQLLAHNSETGQPFALLEVKRVFIQKIADMSEQEAIHDGFVSKADFIDCIQGIYEGLTLEEPITVVEFSLIAAVNA